MKFLLVKELEQTIHGGYNTFYKMMSERGNRAAQAYVQIRYNLKRHCLYAYIAGVYTNEDYRKQGLQNTIFEEIVKDYQHLEMSLSVLPNNTSAINLYLKHGFTLKEIKEYRVMHREAYNYD